MAPGQQLGGGFDYVFLALDPAEEADAEAGDDPCPPADVGADDDVTARGGATGGVISGSGGGSVGVDGQRRAGGCAYALVADAEVEDGVFDVELDGRGLAFELNDLVSSGEWVDGSLKEIVAGVAVEIAVGLGEWDQLRGAVEGVEGERAVLFRKAKIFGDLDRKSVV